MTGPGERRGPAPAAGGPASAAGLAGEAARIVRFLAVGGAAAGLYVALSTALVELAHWRAGVASIIAYGVCIPAAYAGQKLFAFASPRAHRIALPRYIALQLAGLILAAALAEGLSGVAGVPPVVSFLVAAGAVAAFNYLVMSRWVFLPR